MKNYGFLNRILFVNHVKLKKDHKIPILIKFYVEIVQILMNIK